MSSFAGNLSGEAPPPAEPLSLWYRQPATVWTSALPVGNGRQGAMMFGGIDSEVLCLNEDTFWAGGPYTPDNPDALSALAEVRQLIWDGKYANAQRLISQKMMAKPLGQLPYQPIGDLLLEFPSVANSISALRQPAFGLRPTALPSRANSSPAPLITFSFCA
jgi:alpha-L-fucosidase 2